MEQAIKEELEQEAHDEGISLTEFVNRSIVERIDRKKESGLKEKPIPCLNVSEIYKRDQKPDYTISQIIASLFGASSWEYFNYFSKQYVDPIMNARNEGSKRLVGMKLTRPPGTVLFSKDAIEPHEKLYYQLQREREMRDRDIPLNL